MNTPVTFGKLECKKMFRSLPGILAGTCLILLVLASIAFISEQTTSTVKDTNTIHIGIVAAKDEPYLDFVFTTVREMKSMQFTTKFSFVSEKAGTKQLKNGTLSALFLIPHNYVASLINGSNKKIRIRFAQSQQSIVQFLLKQIASAASEYILDTEAGIYTFDDYYRDNHLKNRKKNELALNIEYIQRVLGRNSMAEVKNIEATGKLSTPLYYFIAALSLLFLLFGLSCSSIARPESRVLCQKLRMEGVGIGLQTGIRYLAFFLLSLANYLFVTILVVLVIRYGHIAIDGIPLRSTTDWLRWVIRCIPILLLANSVILLCYEIFSDRLGGIIFLFATIIGLGFLSGCFYPLVYLPEVLQNIATFLPPRILFCYLSESLTNGPSMQTVSLLLGSTLVINGVLVVMRRLQMEGKEAGAI